MSDKLDLVMLLEHGDVLIRKADNGFSTNHLNPNSDKTYDDSDLINPNVLITELHVFDDELNDLEEKQKLVHFLYDVIEAMGIYQSKHDRYRVNIEVQDQGPYDESM